MRTDCLGEMALDADALGKPSAAKNRPARSGVRGSVRLWGAACLVLLLSGCSLLSETRENVEQDIALTNTLREQMRERSEPFAVLTHARARITGEEIRLKEEAEALPPLFNEPIAYVTSGQTLEETLEMVSRQVGVPMWLTEFASEGESVSRNASSSSTNDERGRITIQIHYDGPLRGLLDQLAQSARLHWRYHEGRVEFFLYETRHFYVNVPMGKRTVESSIASSGGGGGGEGGGNQDTGSLSVNMENVQVDAYNVITRAIAAILMEDDGQADLLGSGETEVQMTELVSGGSSGSSDSSDKRRGANRVVVAPEMAMVTVTAQPTSLDRVADYIEHINRRFSRNVVIDVKIYDVTVTDKANVGFSLDQLTARIGSYGLVLTPGSINVIRPNGSIPPGVTMNAVANALQEFGRTSLVTSGQVIGINGQPAPLQLGTEQSYVSDVKVDVDSTGLVPVTRISSVTSRVNTGLTANFLPQMLVDNRILLQYQLTSRTAAFDPGPIVSGIQIQLPIVSSQTLQQQAFVRDGEAIVLFGFGQNSQQSTGSQSVVLNAARGADTGHTQRVIVMQIFGGGPNGNAYL